MIDGDLPAPPSSARRPGLGPLSKVELPRRFANPCTKHNEPPMAAFSVHSGGQASEVERD
jgi:hypothetical protein